MNDKQVEQFIVDLKEEYCVYACGARYIFFFCWGLLRWKATVATSCVGVALYR